MCGKVISGRHGQWPVAVGRGGGRLRRGQGGRWKKRHVQEVEEEGGVYVQSYASAHARASRSTF